MCRHQHADQEGNAAATANPHTMRCFQATSHGAGT